MAIVKSCLGCGDDAEPGKSRCRNCRLPRTNHTHSRRERHRTAAWDRLSARLRKASPYCELCGATTDLVVDHIIPVSEDPTLALEPLNCRVLCRSDNARRQATCTNDERQMVRDRIAAKKARLARYHAQQH
jgi:5-methylcytosine-specific restriction endonuclease McrA